MNRVKTLRYRMLRCRGTLLEEDDIMSTLALAKRPFGLPSILIKVAMAISGLGMALWLTLHMLGNMLWLAGAEIYNAYGEKLRESGVLWPVRTLLIVGFIVHVLGAVLTTSRAHRARPVAYRVHGPIKRAGAVASRSMRWTGLVLLGFVVYHVAIVYGAGHPNFAATDPRHNLMVLLQHPLHALALIAASGLIALHLAHGLASSWITLGIVSRAREALVRRVFLTWTAVITAGFAAPAIACWAGMG